MLWLVAKSKQLPYFKAYWSQPDLDSESQQIAQILFQGKTWFSLSLPHSLFLFIFLFFPTSFYLLPIFSYSFLPVFLSPAFFPLSFLLSNSFLLFIIFYLFPLTFLNSVVKWKWRNGQLMAIYIMCITLFTELTDSRQKC